ncbi:PDR/VanB family oxidoreductase [Pseudolysinimonas yzui]|uniref:Ferredoxin n=1 Tax=Pseudolysinimonas yzui TaxID=2708254 RepID=A0A8J3DU76_9MICO|nr:PDR/VanB family oxidoreductase [Pseudolysinimonas yzui]GHF05058.1 ferredoxin [Pseudolysinimonas yzui]
MSRLRGAAFTPVVVSREAVGDVVVLELAPLEGRRLPGWRPGAHLDVVIPPSAVPGGLTRQYSLIGDPAAPTWRIAVLREAESGGGSTWLHGVREGDTLQVGGPHNHFEFRAGPAPVLFLAGGVGITPISAMAHAAAATGRDYAVHYAGRAGNMALVDDLRALHGERLHLYRDGVRLDLPGVLGAAAPGTAVYACGPARLLDEAEAEASRAGLEFHAERFVAVPLRAPVWPEPFEVELQFSGLTLEVPPEKSILEVVEEHGVLVPWSCSEGTCGTCETPVAEGEIDHRDSILTAQERARMDTMFICVSRAACPRLVLEL